MRTVLTVLFSLALVLTFASALVEIPGQVAAVEYSGTSPAFSTGTSWTLVLGYFGVGDLIEWYWTTSSTLDFALIRTTDTTIALTGYSSSDGYAVDVTGFYGLRWHNNNWFSSATVSYSVAAFAPSLSVSTPLEGSYVNSRTISVQGATDPYSTGVLVGPDALHLKEADWSGNDWGVDGLVLNEGQNSILVRSYYWLDQYGYKNITYDKTIHVTVDTVPPELSITSPLNDTETPAPVSLTWHCSDQTSGIARQEYSFVEGMWIDVSSLSPPYVVVLPALGDGRQMICVRAIDGAGNQAQRYVHFVEDSTAPELTILYPLEGGYTSSKLVEWRATDNWYLWLPFRANVDSTGWFFVEDFASIYQLNVPDGLHSFQVEAVDAAGNSVVRMVNFTLDTTSPEVSITGPLTGAHVRGDYVDVTWQSSDNIGIAETSMKIDRGIWEPVNGLEAKQLRLGSGYHVVQIRVTDNAGSQTISSVEFNNDNRAFSFGGPYYGLPLAAIIVGVILAGLFIALTLLKKRHAPASPPTQPPVAPPSAP